MQGLNKKVSVETAKEMDQTSQMSSNPSERQQRYGESALD